MFAIKCSTDSRATYNTKVKTFIDSEMCKLHIYSQFFMINPTFIASITLCHKLYIDTKLI